VVALAVLGMARSLAPDRPRATLAATAAVLVLVVPSAWAQIGAIVLGGAAGFILYRSNVVAPAASLNLGASPKVGAIALTLFAAFLIALPLAAANSSDQGLKLFDAFYRAGSLVFGGGHVVLPLLNAAVVPPGWVSNDSFLAGYGAAQAVPGPLFTFAAYLGAVIGPAPNGVAGAALCLVAIFLPSFLLVIGALPFWEKLRSQSSAQAVLKGVNAAVVGILLAALYQPVWTAGILGARDFALAVAAFVVLFVWRAPPWLVVALCAIAGAALS
jgi:chromate transporter